MDETFAAMTKSPAFMYISLKATMEHYLETSQQMNFAE